MNQVAIQKQDAPKEIKLHEDIEQRTAQFHAALPAHIPVERFKRVLMTALGNNPTLVRADRRTMFMSAMKAAQDGLLPNGIEGALVIYKTKVKDGSGGEQWVDAVQWMPMIAGIRKKVRNSGEISTWEVHAVYSKDEFDYMLGDEPRIHHKPILGGDRGDLIAAYSIATLKTGEKSREIMSAQEIRNIWKTSSKNKDKSGNPTGPWKDHEAEMFRKTVARRHSKVLPMSTDLDDLMRRDDALYNMTPATDNNITLPPVADTPRPKLADFLPEAVANEQVDEDGVIIEKEQNRPASTQGDDEKVAALDPASEGAATDSRTMKEKAFAEGQSHAGEGRSLRAMPPLYREDEVLSDAYAEGFNSNVVSA